MGPELIIAIVIACVGASTGIIGLIAGSKERKANAESKQSSAAASIALAYDRLNDALTERIDSLEKRNEESLKSIEELKQCVSELERKVVILEFEKDELTKENIKLRERIKSLEDDCIEEDCK